MRFVQLPQKVLKICGFVWLAVFAAAQAAKADDLQGQDSLDTNGTPSGIWSSGNLQNWRELQDIPLREVLNPGPVSNKVFTVSFPHSKNSKPGIEGLKSFTPSSNVLIVAGPTLTTDGDVWTYTLTVDVTNDQPGTVEFFARMRAGAHLFGGSSLHLYSPPLQIHKPQANVGSPDLAVTKLGPTAAYPGQVITYTLTYTNQAVTTGIGVQLTDILPGSVAYVPGSASGDGRLEGGAIIWDLSNVSAGSSAVFTYQVTVNSEAEIGSTFTNNAQIFSSQVDNNEADNVALITTTVVASSSPIANPDIYYVDEDNLLTVIAPSVLLNDTHAEGKTLTSILATNPSHGTLTFNTNGSFTYLSETNFNGVDSFAYQVNDGTEISLPTIVTINVAPVNDAPSINISSPTNNTVFINGQNCTIVADAFDPDGAITNVQFFAGTNLLSSTTNAPYFFVWTNLVAGTYQLTAVGTDNNGLSVTSTVVTISVLERLPLTFVGPIIYDGQVNLFKQVVRVSNPTPFTLEATRVLVFGLTNGAKVFNATGSNGVPFVQFNQTILSGGTAQLTIEYYVPKRVAPTPTLIAEIVTTLTPAPVDGIIVPVDRVIPLPDNTVLIEFTSLLNRVYAIQYSSDMATWKTVVPTVIGNGSRVQWIDNGPPKTESLPGLSGQRFYRVILLP